MQRFDVIVIGGGHAGAEAAALSARSGCRTLLLTQNLATIGQMSCNPAIGGIAKGTVVREVDALGGIMGRATDLARIQFRMLNRSKGPAVWSPRAQCDRRLYREAVQSLLRQLPNLEIRQGTAGRLVLRGERVAGLETLNGERIAARSIVLTAGTFLRGRIHVGHREGIPAGRAGEPPAAEISQHLATLGLAIGRFKTGTPPRINGESVDLASLARQDGDGGHYWFSSYERATHPSQRPCYLTWAGPEVKAVIQEHLGKSALYGGMISGRGPRYCPSIEDKIVKFPAAERHQVFLEPEGLDTPEMYVNGLSTSLPPEVQLEFLRRVPGLESVEMTRAGYAIEYDYFPPTQLAPSLEVRAVPGLFMAGQINGTTGYEEAAAQGAIAGLNAAASAKGRAPVVFRRDEAFIGVLVDDLVTRGVDEPYRLFTSRSEYRLLLRQDNALRRLLPTALDRRLLTDLERGVAEARLSREDAVLTQAQAASVPPLEADRILREADFPPAGSSFRVSELVRRQGVHLLDALDAAGVEVEPADAEWAEIEVKYEGYLAREAVAAARMARMEAFPLPEDLAYAELHSLSTEGREKLHARRPATLGQASRIPGVSASDLQSLLNEVARR